MSLAVQSPLSKPVEACKDSTRAVHYFPLELRCPVEWTLATCDYLIVNVSFSELNKIKNSGP